MSRLHLIAAGTIGLLLTLTGFSKAADVPLRAGAAAVDISPRQYPVIINGGFLPRLANKLNDPIFARALVCDDGTTKLAICVVDSCLMPRDLLDAAKAAAAKQTGIPASNMLVSATHTHTAPSVMGALGTPADPNYPPVLVEGITQAIVRAHKNLEPAAVAWGNADAGAYNATRRWIRRSDRIMKDPFGEATVRANMHPGYLSVDAIGPSGPADPELTVLSVQAQDGRPIALLANFAMHYFSGPQPVSADYFSIFCRDVAKELKVVDVPGKPPFVGIMSQGTSGDTWRADYGKPKPKPEITIEQYAGDLAKLAANAVTGKKHTSASLAMASADIRVKARYPSPARQEWAKSVIEKMPPATRPTNGVDLSIAGRIPKNQSDVYALEVGFLVEKPETNMLLQAIRIGDFGLTALPNEVYALTGLKIKSQSPLAGTMNIELANDELGYIPPPEQHKLGGYTTWAARSSYTAEETEPKMVETVLTLLEKVAGKPRKPIDIPLGDYAATIRSQQPIFYSRLEEMVAGKVASQIGKVTGIYEDGIAFWLEGPQGAGLQPAGVNRAPHFAGGRLVYDLNSGPNNRPALGTDYAVSFFFWNGLANEARPVTGYLFSSGPAGKKALTGDHLGIGGTHENGKTQGRLILFNGDERNELLSGKTTIGVRTWNHVVLSRKGKHVSVYLNGQPEIDGEITATAGGSTLYFGGRSDGFSGLEGKLDEVAVFDQPLTAAQALAQFKSSGVAPPAPATQPATQPSTQPAAQSESGSGAASTTPLATRPSGMRLSQPLSPAESAKLTIVHPRFELELVASEPLVQSPVAFNWGPDRRLWVVEMADYPYGEDGKMKPSGRVRWLRDSKGDGTYDQSVVFAEGLNFPTGVLPWRKGVIVTAAPDILYLEDTDGDGKADLKRVLFTGFTEGNPQLRVNAPNYGLDGWVYVANGLSSKGKVKAVGRVDGKPFPPALPGTGEMTPELAVSGRDIRIRPDTGEMETETGPSQFGRRRNDWGDWFGVHNSYPGRQWVIPERYAKRNPYATLPPGNNDLGFTANPKVYPLSQGQKRYGTAFFAQSGRFTSACGISIDRDVLLFGDSSADQVDHLFTCEPVHNLIQHNLLKPRGTTFVAERSADESTGEFLSSRDEWFRPVYTTTGPDGALYVADMYRFMIEHPDWLPAEGKEDYRPYYRLGENRGRIWRIKPKGAMLSPMPNLAGMNTVKLIETLTSTNGTLRDLAMMMLIWQRSDLSQEPLERLFEKSQEPRARLQILATLQGMNRLTARVVGLAIRDPHPGVRRLGVQFAETHADAAPDLLNYLAEMTSDPSMPVRLQLALSLGEIKLPAAGRALGSLAVSEAGDDLYLPAAIMTSAKTHLEALTDALLQHPDSPMPILESLQAMALASGDRALLNRLIQPTVSPSERVGQTEQFQRLARFLDVLQQQRKSIDQLSGAKQDELTLSLAKIPPLCAKARSIAATPASTVLDRSLMLHVLGYLKADRDADSALAGQILETRGNLVVKNDAVRLLVRLGGDDLPKKILPHWADLWDYPRGVAIDAMLSREAWSLALLDELESGRVDRKTIDSARQQRLIRHASIKVRERTKTILGDPTAGRAKVVSEYATAANLKGDPDRGLKVFTQNCATCHRSGTTGADIGPNLASVAGWPADALVTAVFDPSRSAEPRYLGYTAVLDTGEAVYGLVTSETPSAVVMKGLDGVERTLARTRIKSLDCTNRSLMPDGLESAISVEQMADLIAYLHAAR